MFADTIIQTLGDQEGMLVTGCAASVAAALDLMEGDPPDVVVYVDTHGGAGETLCALTARYPELAFIKADLTSSQLRLITSKCIRASSDELVAAISGLPRSQFSENGSGE